jgi:hypothetical protein
MQHDDQSMLVAERVERGIELHYVIQLFRIPGRVEVPRQHFEALSRQLIFADGNQPEACETPPVVDEVVVHDTAKPRTGFLNFYEFANAGIYLGEDILKQVLRLRPAAGKTKRQAIQSIEMRPDQGIEVCSLIVISTTHVPECNCGRLLHKAGRAKLRTGEYFDGTR